MAASPPVTALPWYDRRDYPALLKLFSDPDKLPATYDAWLERAEGVERQFKRAGFGVARIWIRPVPFADFIIIIAGYRFRYAQGSCCCSSRVDPRGFYPSLLRFPHEG